MIDHKKDKYFMRLAIKKAREGIKKGQAPFAACIVRNGRVLSLEHNRVWQDKDITAHAEIVAIRAACRKINGIDLSGATIYSTCEPCPMCFSAIHWARIKRIVYGSSIKDALNYGFHELKISNKRMKGLSGSRVISCCGILKEESQDLFNTDNKKVY